MVGSLILDYNNNSQFHNFIYRKVVLNCTKTYHALVAITYSGVDTVQTVFCNKRTSIL